MNSKADDDSCTLGYLGELIIELYQSETRFEKCKEKLITRCPNFNVRSAFKVIFTA